MHRLSLPERYSPAPTLAEGPVRPFVVGLVVVGLLLAGAGLAIWRLSRPDPYGAAVAALGPTGDPGGRILAQLRPLRSIVPPGAKLNYAQFYEPHPDSCDGNPSTVGWDPATVNMAFSDPAPSPLPYVIARLQQLGWQVVEPTTSWTKVLKNHTSATAFIDFSDGWEFTATAPADGPAPTGC